MISAARKRFQPARRRRDELTSPFGGDRFAIDTSKVLSTLPIPVEADEGNAALLYIGSSAVNISYGEQLRLESAPLGLSGWIVGRRVKVSLDIYYRLPNAKHPEVVATEREYRITRANDQSAG